MIVKYNDTDITGLLLSFSKSESYNDNKIIGQTPSKQITICVDNSSGIIENATLLISTISYQKDDTSEIEYYKVYEAPSDWSGDITLTMYDSVYDLGIYYTPTVELPCTMSALISDMENANGITIDQSNIPSTISSMNVDYYNDQATLRANLGYIGELLGANLVCTGSKAYKFKQATERVNYATTEVLSYTKGITSKITRVAFDCGDGLYITSGDVTGQTIWLSGDNPFLNSESQAIIDYIYSVVKGMEFTGSSNVEIESITGLTLGDVVTLNGEFSTLITSMSEKLDGSPISDVTIACSFKETTESNSGTVAEKVNKVKKEVSTVSADVAYIQTAYVKTAEVGDLIAESIVSDEAVIKNLQSNYAEIDLANIKDLTGEKLEYALANIDTLNSQTAFIKDLTSDTISSGISESIVSNVENGYTQNAVAKLLLAQALMSDYAEIGVIKSKDIVVGDTDGNTLELLGATQILKDSDGNIRVVLGKHNDNDYNLSIYDADGNELFNADGVTYDGALKSDIVNVINNDGYSDKIDVTRLNISSLINVLNGKDYLTDANGNKLYVYKDSSGNITYDSSKAVKDSDGNPKRYYIFRNRVTESLKASAILYDATEQTLDVLFSNYVVGENSVLQSSYQLHNGLLDFLISNVSSTALTEKPYDWDYAYYKYYYYDSTDKTYKHISSATEWETGKYYAQNTDYSQIKMTDDAINLISNNVNVYADKIKFDVDHEFNVNDNFIVDKDGNVTMKSADITGGEIHIDDSSSPSGCFVVDKYGNLSIGNHDSTPNFEVSNDGECLIRDGAGGLTVTYTGLEPGKSSYTYAKLINTGLFFRDNRSTTYYKQVAILANDCGVEKGLMLDAFAGSDNTGTPNAYLRLLTTGRALSNVIPTNIKLVTSGAWAYTDTGMLANLVYGADTNKMYIIILQSWTTSNAFGLYATMITAGCVVTTLASAYGQEITTWWASGSTAVISLYNGNSNGSTHYWVYEMIG